MIKLLVLVLFICILFSAGIIKALAFLGFMLILGPILLLVFGATAYAATRANSKRNSWS